MKRIPWIFTVAIINYTYSASASEISNENFTPSIEGTRIQEKEEFIPSLPQNRRNPKLFFGTTETTTTTLSTETACYTSTANAAAIVQCTARRRRSLLMDNPIEGATYDFDSGMISPSSSVNTREKREPRQNSKSISLSKLDELNQIANVRTSDGVEIVDERVEPRFFAFYWYTSTITSTATTFSATRTFTIASCTPAGFTYSACG